MFSHICSTSEERPLVETARNAIAKHETPPAHRAVGASMGGIGSQPTRLEALGPLFQPANDHRARGGLVSRCWTPSMMSLF